MRTLILLVLSAFVGFSVAGELRDPPAPDGLRPGGTLSENLPVPALGGDRGRQGREIRNYPEQPPVIPHTIRDYQVDKRYNHCLTCHSRQAAPEAGAPMVSVTHFVDREGQVRGAVAPNRYFCMACHVPQEDVRPLVGNDFKAVDDILRETVR